jgi:hypothetical protein
VAKTFKKVKFLHAILIKNNMNKEDSSDIQEHSAVQPWVAEYLQDCEANYRIHGICFVFSRKWETKNFIIMITRRKEESRGD